jgi:uncharacterized protein (TIGR02145 family)
MKSLLKTFGLLLLCILVYCCKKEKPTPPSIVTTDVTEISYNSAASGGNITAENGDPVTARGICWSSTSGPTIDNSKTTDGTGMGNFVSNLSGLSLNTKYYVRAYASNISGTAYGNEISFTTSPAVIPTLTTNTASRVTHSHALIGGTIASDGGISTTSRGVCWSTSSNPTITDSKTSDLFGLSPGFFPSFVSGLSANTVYYVRAYATNSIGTGYGQQVQFTTLTNYTGQTGTANDIDGNIYHTIGIGSQIWMAENLKTTKFNDGATIQNITSDAEWTALTTSAYCIYNNDLNNKSVYGLLYNWWTLDVSTNGNRNVCPTGWHLPSNEEWNTLTNYLGETSTGIWSNTTLSAGSNIGGKMLKETGTTHWNSPNTGTNVTGFTALGAGYRELSGFFNKLGKYGTWWTTTSLYNGSEDAYINGIYNDNTVLSNGTTNKSFGASIRCIKN